MPKCHQGWGVFKFTAALLAIAGHTLDDPLGITQHSQIHSTADGTHGYNNK
jgi:hypothetical protein